MAITRLWQAGAESYSLDEFSNYLNNVFIASGTANTGSFSFADGDTNRYYFQTIPATRQIRVGFFVYGNTSIETVRFAIRDSGGSNLIALDFKTNGSIALEIPEGAQKDIEPGINVEEWHHIGVDVKINSSSGWAYIYFDGSLVMSFDGNTGNADIVDVLFGHTTTVGTFICYWDDLYIDDTTGESSPTAPSIKRFYPLNVNGDGNYSQWTPIPTGSHYLNVDERPPDDDTTYLEAVTGSLLDSFTMTTFTLDTNEDIIAMIPFVFAKRGSTTEKLSLGTRSSGTDLIGSDQDLSTSYDYIWERQITGSLGSLWNQSYMDSVEVIINSTGTY